LRPRMAKWGRRLRVGIWSWGRLGWGRLSLPALAPGDGRALAAGLAGARGVVACACALWRPARSLLDQLLWRACKNGPASGSRRIGIRCAGPLGFARRFLFVPARRAQAQRPYALYPAEFR